MVIIMTSNIGSHYLQRELETKAARGLVGGEVG